MRPTVLVDKNSNTFRADSTVIRCYFGEAFVTGEGRARKSRAALLSFLLLANPWRSLVAILMSKTCMELSEASIESQPLLESSSLPSKWKVAGCIDMEHIPGIIIPSDDLTNPWVGFAFETLSSSCSFDL